MTLEIGENIGPAAFIDEVVPFLMQEEVVNCIMLSLLLRAQLDPDRLDALYLGLVREDGEVAACALQTSLKMLLSHASAPGAMALLAEDAHWRNRDGFTVMGPDSEARVFVERWTEVAGIEP